MVKNFNRNDIINFLFKNNVIKLIIIGFLLTSCTFFEPRESEKPEESVPWNDYFITYDLTLNNLIYAYQYSQNSDKFSNLFSDDYNFYFDEQDISDFNPPDIWSKNDETNSLINIHNALDNSEVTDIIFSKSNTHSDLIFSDHVIIYRNYSLHIPHNLNNIPQDFKGWFEIEMKPNTYGFWKITRWIDHRTETYWSWGRLKYEFE